jgi:hypothetical protein
MDTIPDFRPPHYEKFSSIPLDPSIPEAAREILSLLPASQQHLVWSAFVGIAAHGCRNPTALIRLALRPMKRSLDRTAATNDLRTALVIMFENHHVMLDLARAAIDKIRREVRRA